MIIHQYALKVAQHIFFSSKSKKLIFKGSINVPGRKNNEDFWGF
jgi:hypothetical protein